MIEKDFGLFDKCLFDKKDSVNFAYLLGAAVILDSHNFQADLRDSKWSSEDEKARDFLNRFTKLDEKYYDGMEANKHDAKLALSLGFQGNLRRDYKQYSLVKNGKAGTLGIPVIVCTLEDMFKEYGKDQLCEEICQHMTDEKLSMFGIHFNILNKATNVVDRLIFVFSKLDGEFANSYEDFVKACQASDLLKTEEPQRGSYKNCQYALMPLGNNSVSRKKWEVVFRAFYAQ